ncbi:MAG: D-alanyl-D-alanine carboxypeptidase [Gammaproteobacteria bacterium]|nr:D-alanyl-D-alanine carboxypeptidase [Gammaproteobacteria bacterium]
MKHYLILSSLLLSLSSTVIAAPPKLTPAAPQLAATGYILQDSRSGYIIAEKNADKRLEPASLTKIMTIYAVFYELQTGSISLTDETRVSEKAWRSEGSRMFIEVGKMVSVEELLMGVIVQSGNDASVALAEHVAGSETSFADLMNEHVRNLGMTDTHFVNSTGLPHAEHYTTARDMARLAGAIIRDFPDYYPWFSIKKYKYNGIEQYNRNKLLWRDDRVTGLKTGHTESAGYCLVASAQEGEMNLISVVMGTKSEKARTDESRKLLGYGFRFFESHQLFAANTSIKDIRIWKGETENLPLGLAEPLHVTVARGRYKNLEASMSVNQTVEAPVQKGHILGAVQVKLGDELINERPLVALQDIKQGSLWQRFVDSLAMWLQ